MTVWFSLGWLAVAVFVWLRGEQLHDFRLETLGVVLLVVWVAEVLDNKILRTRRRR